MTHSIFESNLIRLRGMEPEDWLFFHQFDRDTDSARMSYHIPFPGSQLAARQWAEAEALKKPILDEYRFAIENNNGELVGTLNTHSCNLQNGTFSYGLAIAPEFRRRGYATESILLVLHYYFYELRYQKANATVYSCNPESIALHQHLGFTLEGQLRRMEFNDGQFHDHLLFGMTIEEFEEKYSARLRQTL